MFPTTNLFKEVACPEGEQCKLVNCIFSHKLRPQRVGSPATLTSVAARPSTLTVGNDDESDGHHSKRRRLDDQLERAGSDKPAQRKVFVGALSSQETTKPPKVPQSVTTLASLANSPVLSASKEVTPPPLSNKVRSEPTSLQKSTPETEKIEPLNPRMITNDPVGHAKRAVYLQAMAKEMRRLNELQRSADSKKEALCLSEAEINKFCLNEEEKLARESGPLYKNMVSGCIAAYRKMSLSGWISHILANFTEAKAVEKPAPKAELSTGLTTSEEVLFLPRLLTDLTSLSKHGYVSTPPTAAEAAEAAAAVQASANYEKCDRCQSRFQVFPERREEDGALTSNGPCVHHWGKPIHPKREKTDAIKGAKDPTFSCCNQLLGTKGCTELSTHVFVVKDAKRLASISPFVETPENLDPAKGVDGKAASAVTFDCEMGYTVYGLECIRLTAVTWPEGVPLVDVLV
ncbi:RNA exonuclease 3, partial [Elasticomyces elasticus]